MKVALVHCDIKGDGLGGGITRLYIELGKHLSLLGCKVTYVTSVKAFKPNWGEVEHISLDRDHPEIYRQKLADFLSSGNFDIVECSSWGFEALEYAESSGHSPIVVRADISAKEFSQGTVVQQERRLMELAQAKIAISFSVQSYFKQHYNIPISQTIWNGVNSADFPPSDRSVFGKKIVWVGKVNKVKGFDTLAKIVERLPNYNFRVVLGVTEGQGSIDLPNVQMHGDISTEELYSYYKEATYVLSSSRYEPFGLPLLEGMSSGLIPLIPENSGGPNEFIINNYNGVTFSSIEDLITKLEQLSDHKNLSDNPISTSKEFSWRRCALETLALYRTLATK